MNYPNDFVNKVICGDALEVLKEMPEKSVNMCITSPPYWALRDYGVEGQLGLEPTFDEYIDKLCDVFDEVKRVLRKDGTCWVVMGDTYNAGGNYRGKELGDGSKEAYKRKDFEGCKNDPNEQGIERKSLLQIPFRFSIEMCNRGWILRNVIIWHKPNAMPSSVKDRFTVDFEYLFFFSKKKKYYFEQQFESHKTKNWRSKKRQEYGDIKAQKKAGVACTGGTSGFGEKGRNKRTTWSINTQSFPDAHFAVYPEELIETPIKAGCPEDGIILDPFFGAGTTGVVAKKQSKNYIGIDLNKEYCKMARERIRKTQKELF